MMMKIDIKKFEMIIRILANAPEEKAYHYLYTSSVEFMNKLENLWKRGFSFSCLVDVVMACKEVDIAVRYKLLRIFRWRFNQLKPAYEEYKWEDYYDY